MGTIRDKRIENALPKDVNLVKKSPSGTMDQVTYENTVRIKDDNVITIASTFVGVNPTGKVKRWSNSEKKYIHIDHPACVHRHNSFMGDVDRMDWNIACYRVNIRNRKWYWPLICHLLNTTMKNAWQLYRQTAKGKDLLGFTRKAVLTYLTKNKTTRMHPERSALPVKCTYRVNNADRLNKNVLHTLKTGPA